jgi:hypothetical protein
MGHSNGSAGRSVKLAAITVACIALVAGAMACGKSSGSGWDGTGGASGNSGGGGGSGGSGLGNQSPDGGNGNGFVMPGGGMSMGDSGTVMSSSGGPPPLVPAMGSITAQDCTGSCTFPGPNAMPCASSAPALQIVYPPDNVLLPPNMNVLSVHWTPFGGYQRYSVDFNNGNNTDWHIITTCANQTNDMQTSPPTPSGGCEVVVDPVSWSKLVGANRGQGPVTITVRGTTDGTCATASSNQVHMSFATEDLLGTYYYWKSTVSANGTGGQIWKQTFGDLNTPEADVTTAAIQAATCNGCHSLSRDGTRMVVYSDDDDSDDEYNDVAGSYLDMTTNPATELMGGVTGVRMGGQPPGFSTIDPTVTSATTSSAQGYYVTSNGIMCTTAGGGGGGGLFGGGGRGGGCGSSNGYPTAVPANGWSVWNGTSGAFVGGVTIGASGTRPTMPDWSPDGMSVVYVVPAGEFTTWRNDDAHIYGGALWTVPYAGNGTFGAPAVFLQSNGENNYYPSYSPDVPMSFIIFNRVDSTGQNANCSGGFCTDDSFSNPAARLLLLSAKAAGGTPIDLETANGSPAASKVPLSNSYPRWAPFVQTYKGNKLLWFTFSSTRDYGLRVLNHKSGMYQCYPADSAESPGSPHGQGFDPQCQEPQLWMAPLFFAEAQGSKDPSGPAFWIPYQDITTHNHTAQWTQQHVTPPPPPMNMPPTCSCQSMTYGKCGAANGGCGCCTGMGLVCTGSNTCFSPPH